MRRFLFTLAICLLSTRAQADVLIFEDTVSPLSVNSYTFSANRGDILTAGAFGTSADLDTILGLFRPDGTLAAGNDDRDDSPLALFPALSFVADETGDWQAKLSGFPDFDFDGSHIQEGDYRLVITTADTGTEVENNDTIPGATALAVLSNGGSRMGGTLDDLDLDFYSFQAVAGSTISIDVYTDGFDSMVGLFDSNGDLIELDDDGGEELGSALYLPILVSGTYYIGVTGFGDLDFEGDHDEIGEYKLVVTGVVPEPSSLALASIACLTLAAYGRRRLRC